MAREQPTGANEAETTLYTGQRLGVPIHPTAPSQSPTDSPSSCFNTERSDTEGSTKVQEDESSEDREKDRPPAAPPAGTWPNTGPNRKEHGQAWCLLGGLFLKRLNTVLWIRNLMLSRWAR